MRKAARAWCRYTSGAKDYLDIERVGSASPRLGLARASLRGSPVCMMRVTKYFGSAPDGYNG